LVKSKVPLALNELVVSAVHPLNGVATFVEVNTW
jgi:hypothetical protein